MEFLTTHEIRKSFGPEGVSAMEVAYGHRGATTDDTQMTLFTAEGLIRAYVRGAIRGICHPPSVVDHAYARWLQTQGERSGRWRAEEFDGWLIGRPELHARRAPGATCLAALRSDRAGTVEQPLNDSKGCGGVMRAAPAGLLPRSSEDPFDLGCAIAALTHGHPSGYLTAGALALIVHDVVWEGASLDHGLDRAVARLRETPGSGETVAALDAARRLAASGAAPSPETVETLGAGWVAEEALAIAVYAALVAEDLPHGLRVAVNHSGDSDSTGAIAGNLLGALHGSEAIPGEWAAALDLPCLEELVADWVELFAGPSPVDLENDRRWWDRYPGW